MQVDLLDLVLIHVPFFELGFVFFIIEISIQILSIRSRTKLISGEDCRSTCSTTYVPVVVVGRQERSAVATVHVVHLDR